MRKLTDKQQRFVDEYLIDLNATQACIRAGYSEKTADRIGPELLGKTCVAAALSAAKKERSEKTKIDSTYVLNRLIEIDQMDVIDILNDDGSVMAISKWPKIWRQFVSGMDLSELFEGHGEDREIVGFLKKIKWPDKIKNLELLGRHVDVQAWKDQKELSGHIGLGTVLDELDGASHGLPTHT